MYYIKDIHNFLYLKHEQGLWNIFVYQMQYPLGSVLSSKPVRYSGTYWGDRANQWRESTPIIRHKVSKTMKGRT